MNSTVSCPSYTPSAFRLHDRQPFDSTTMTVFVAPPSAPALPLELLETVLSFLYSDPKSLRAASLVSRAWVPICRVRLFRRIVLHWCDEGLRRSECLYSLLTRRPHIAKYIHELSIHEGLVSSKQSQVTSCFAQSTSLPQLLPLLPQLYLIEFRASTLTPWCELSGELVHALLHAITASSTLTDVVLGSWNFTSEPRALDALLEAITQNAKSLVLTDIVAPFASTRRQAIRPYSGFDQRHAALQSLTINEGEASSLSFCTEWFRERPTRIKSLQLSCSTMQTSISEFLGVLGESLEHLELNIHTVRGNTSLDLSHNTRLRNLQLQVLEHPIMSLRSKISVSWLVNILSTLRSFECLELLHIGFEIDADRLRRLSQSDANHWSQLDQILCPKKYHRLSSVQIGIKFQCHDDLEYIKEKLGAFAASTIVSRLSSQGGAVGTFTPHFRNKAS
ncbi:hypothetical protein D9756_004672 [Leucocoprinus leucothites]|uniref:F-box domain-containing protein n=1 Tax=Leucocoprinus leucothites TaxID=201217 RepID=A0A8H5LKG0_9AGAR|nr:hypothetical protein D9756_004672 [Leucoagaricus leucothites]